MAIGAKQADDWEAAARQKEKAAEDWGAAVWEKAMAADANGKLYDGLSGFGDKTTVVPAEGKGWRGGWPRRSACRRVSVVSTGCTSSVAAAPPAHPAHRSTQNSRLPIACRPKLPKREYSTAAHCEREDELRRRMCRSLGPR